MASRAIGLTKEKHTMSDETNKQILELVQQIAKDVAQGSTDIAQLSKDVEPIRNIDLRLLARNVNHLMTDAADLKDRVRGIEPGSLMRLEAGLTSLIHHLQTMQSHWDRLASRVAKLEEKAEPANKPPELPGTVGPEEGERAMSNRFTLEVTMDTPAFDDGRRAELARILNHVSGEAETGIEGGDRPLRDSDGNVVGHYTGMPK
jgi:hypothetical protein